MILLAVACSSAFKPIPQPVDSSDFSVQSDPHLDEDQTDESVATESSRYMGEFYQLRQELLISTLLLTGLAFGPVWWFYSLQIALNFLLGAFTGIVYLRLLARNVERLGVDSQSVGKSQIAVFVGVIVVATQWSQLQVLPIFFGFLMYKAAVLVYTLRTALSPQ